MNGLGLALSYARREMRGGLSGFRIFVACLALGVAAIAGVGSLSEAISEGLRQDGRRLLGGDIALRLLHRPASSEERAYLNAHGVVSETIEMRAMSKSTSPSDSGGRRTLVELKAVDGAYPLVGAVELKDGGGLADKLKKQDGMWGVVAESNLFTKLKLKPGDRIKVGAATFKLTGIIKKEPDRIASVLSFGPRLMVAGAALADTKLVQPGSQIRYRYRLKINPGVTSAEWTSALKKAFPSAGWRIRGTDQAAPGLQRFIDRMTLFLTFVGLTTLLVGGVGVTNSVDSYLDGRIKTIATLKCLGAAGGFIFQVYFIQIIVLAVLGIFIGLAVGIGLPLLAMNFMEGQLPFDLAVGFYPAPLLIATGFGMLIAVTFALWPLARARSIPANTLFRDKIQPTRTLPGRGYILLTVLCSALLAALTIVSSNDQWFALWFVLGALATLGLLRAGAAGLTKGARAITGIRGSELRLAVTNLHRPGSSTTSIVLSLGLGLSVLVAIALIEGNLSRQINERLPDLAPAFFFIDIQPDQVAAFDATVTGFKGVGDYKRVASLRGRIVKIAGVAVEKRKIAPGAHWAIRGDRALTFAARPAEGTVIKEGKWWPADYKGPPRISLDAHLAKGFGIGIGDKLTVNVLGRDIEAEIASTRTIDWRSLRFDFAIIFAPGVLENAPHSHIAALQAPPALEDPIEKAVTDKFTNVSVIRVREALQAAADILASIGMAVRSTAAITILGGALVLAGAVAAGRRRRVYDAVIFKVLGATRSVILKAFLLEYGILGISTGVISALIGSLTAWAVIVWLMDMQWVFIPAAVGVTLSVCIVLTLIVGFAGTWRALGQKAAPLLRNE